MRTQLKRTPAALCAAIGALALAAPAASQPEERHDGHKLVATLTGIAAAAAPAETPVDTNGAGLFEASVDPAEGRICYTLSAGNIDEATGAHVYRGTAGEAGDPVLTLETPKGDDDDSEECQDVDPALAQALVSDPAEYFVTVRTAEFPDGAIRGQLSG